MACCSVGRGDQRLFRDLAINPAVRVLLDHMFGKDMGGSATRLSSNNAFIKWQGEYGYGSSLGMHSDQGRVPRPYGATAYSANATWCLTDYTREGGALAWVPGSHLFDKDPTRSEATERAIAAGCPRGSCIVWHGATWHGAFPRTIPGMRISPNYYRHVSVFPQEDFKHSFDPKLADDCSDPALFRRMAGLDFPMPYTEPFLPLPSLQARVARGNPRWAPLGSISWRSARPGAAWSWARSCEASWWSATPTFTPRPGSRGRPLRLGHHVEALQPGVPEREGPACTGLARLRAGWRCRLSPGR